VYYEAIENEYAKEIFRMATLELVEKLRTHANVSYDDAREALDACGDDILDAIIYLERKGKVSTPKSAGTYTTEKQGAKNSPPKRPRADDYEPRGETFSQLAGRFFRWLGSLIQKGNRNLFVIHYGKGDTASLPITVLILLLIFALPLSITLLVVGLFFGCRYRFQGKDINGAGVNNVMDGVAGVADDIKRSVQNAVREDDGKNGDLDI
jgi:hypothetical protein